MTSVASAGDPVPGEKAVWWYKDGGAPRGPATAKELRRLADIGILPNDALVSADEFGPHWKSLDEAGVCSDREPPAADYGRWTKAFAKMAAAPHSRPWSLLGAVFGPLAYFRYGMWCKGLVLVAAWLIFVLALTIMQDVNGISLKAMPLAPLWIYCAWHLKRDYFRFRVHGERMWPRLRKLDNVVACGVACLVLMLAVGFAQLGNDVDGLSSDVAGVWEAEDFKIVVDTQGPRKTITYDGVTHPVEVQSADGANGVIVFVDLSDKSTLIAFSKHWEQDGRYSLDLRVNDVPVGNLVYLRPA